MEGPYILTLKTLGKGLLKGEFPYKSEASRIINVGELSYEFGASCLRASFVVFGASRL